MDSLSSRQYLLPLLLLPTLPLLFPSIRHSLACLTTSSTSLSPKKRQSKVLKDKADFDALLDKYDNWLFDCDGVIWRGNTMIPGAESFLKTLRERGKKVIFVTNNATQSRKGYKAKFKKFGLEVHTDEIFGSAYATAFYLKYDLNFPMDKRVYVIGEKGLEEELDSEGIQHCGGSDPEEAEVLSSMDFSSIHSDPSIGAVVCGFDMRLNYKKLAKAFTYLRENKDCLFVLTNDDSTFPHEHALYPGAGSLSAPLRYAVKHKEPIVVGKPNKPMMRVILEKHHLEPNKTVMCGDRLDTDIEFGLQGGISTLLVFSGVTRPEDLEKSSTVPHYILDSIGQYESTVAPS
ncbi:4-nitrophenylphosphatase [Atractiella rhizophila]|nr:4-nitrophenylphosphatase [Atractiella rhizophila]